VLRYVPAFDGLRALAMMLVFLFHTGHLRGGWIGVDIFFVLSGYLITSILVREHETTGVISLSRFYIRRVCRLLPALIVVVCVAVAMAVWFRNQQRDTEIDAASALLYLTDYRYVLMPPVGGGTALLHTWSLSVEEQFYFIWPLLLIVLLTWNRRVVFCATLVLIIIVDVWRISLFCTSSNPYVRIYFAFDARADELLIGCALALWQPQVPTFRFLSRLWPAVVLFFAVVVLKVSPWEGPLLRYIDLVGYPLFGVAVAYVIIIVRSDENSFLTCLLSLPPIVAFGRVSYGFYLWHFLFLSEPSIETRLGSHRTLPIFVLTVTAAVISYWLIERPFLRLKFEHFSNAPRNQAGGRSVERTDQTPDYQSTSGSSGKQAESGISRSPPDYKTRR
jgi:peptidoglycan/LPS O-acetylase OafA/YrhL